MAPVRLVLGFLRKPPDAGPQCRVEVHNVAPGACQPHGIVLSFLSRENYTFLGWAMSIQPWIRASLLSRLPVYSGQSDNRESVKT